MDEPITLQTVIEHMDRHFASIDQRFASSDQRFTSIEGQLDDLRSKTCGLHEAIARIENEHGAKLEALFDGQSLLLDRLDRMEGRLVRVEADTKALRRSDSQLQAIVTDHEGRLQNLEP